jgi:6-pyruvoyl-tetrahydropterin synthase
MRTLTRRYRIRGVHVLLDQKYHEPKHGHEYELHVTVASAAERSNLDAIVQNQILDNWDKQDFMTKGIWQTSGEMLVEEFDRILRASDLGPQLKAVVLKETRKNRFVSARSELLYYE